MNYYWFNRQEILQKAKEKYSKEKAAEYYAQNKEAIKEKSRERYKNLSQEEKDKIKEYQRKRYQKLVQYKNEALKNKKFFVFSLAKKMSEKTLEKGNNKKQFHKSKQQIDLKPINTDQIVVSDKFKHNNESFKYFICYQEGEIVKLLCIILPQISGCIKYFKNGDKNMSFLIKDDEVWEKYEKIWDAIKNKLDIKFYRQPIYEQKYLKAKVREFDGVKKNKLFG